MAAELESTGGLYGQRHARPGPWAVTPAVHSAGDLPPRRHRTGAHGTNLIELVQTVTTVRRTGKSYMAICRSTRKASLSLEPAKAVWYCHGCHQGGDVFKFLMDTKGLDFNDAVEESRIPGRDH